MLETFNLLDSKHPDYLDNVERWGVYRDVIGDSKPEKKKYLPQGALESDSVYALRLKIAEFVPTSVLSVNKLLGALYKTKPTRKLGKFEKQLGPFIGDCDGNGTNYGSMVQLVARNLISYGCSRALVNLKMPQPGAARPEAARGTLAYERSQGLSPILLNYDPLSVIDWGVDEYGEITMVRIREDSVVSPERGKHAVRTKFVEYDLANISWWVFLRGGGDLRLEAQDSRPNTLGLVPIVALCYPFKLRPLIGGGFLQFAALADVRKMRAESDLHYDAYLHAHPILWAKVSEALTTIGIGSGSFIKLDPHIPNEEVGYLQVPASSFEATHKVIELNDRAIVHHTGIDPLGVLQAGSSAFQTSGAARAWSFETSEGRILSSLADSMEVIERRILEMAARYVTPGVFGPKDQVFDGSVSYPDEFDTAATSNLLDDAAKTALQINSPTLIRTVHKRIATALQGEVPQETAEEIAEEIDENPLIGTSAGREAEPTEFPPRAGAFERAEPAEEGEEGEEGEEAGENRAEGGARAGGRRGAARPPRGGARARQRAGTD